MAGAPGCLAPFKKLKEGGVRLARSLSGRLAKKPKFDDAAVVQCALCGKTSDAPYGKLPPMAKSLWQFGEGGEPLCRKCLLNDTLERKVEAERKAMWKREQEYRQAEKEKERDAQKKWKARLPRIDSGTDWSAAKSFYKLPIPRASLDKKMADIEQRRAERALKSVKAYEQYELNIKTILRTNSPGGAGGAEGEEASPRALFQWSGEHASAANSSLTPPVPTPVARVPESSTDAAEGTIHLAEGELRRSSLDSRRSSLERRASVEPRLQTIHSAGDLMLLEDQPIPDIAELSSPISTPRTRESSQGEEISDTGEIQLALA